MSIAKACKYSFILALSLGACAPGLDDEGEERGIGGGKADGFTLPLTPFVDESLNGSISEETHVARSAAEYRDKLGSEPPAHIDFDREWVLFYNAGVLFGGPFVVGAEIARDGDTLRVVTRLTSPAADCPPPVIDPDDDSGGFGVYYLLATFPVEAPAPATIDVVNDHIEKSCDDGSNPGATDCATRTGGAFVTIRVADYDTTREQIQAWVTDEAFIAHAEHLLHNGTQGDIHVPYFKLVNGRDCDQWTWHVEPATARWSGPGVEIYDALPSYVEDNKGSWILPDWQWSPWGAQVFGVKRQ